MKRDHRANRRRQRGGHPGRAAWRKAPATDQQIRALRRIATVTGHTFTITVTRGEAWRRIRLATGALDDQTRRRCAPPWAATGSAGSGKSS